MTPAWNFALLAACFMLISWVALIFNPEDGGDMIPWNVSWLSPDYTALYSRRYNSSNWFICSLFKDAVCNSDLCVECGGLVTDTVVVFAWRLRNVHRSDGDSNRIPSTILLGPLARFQSELIWNYGSFRQFVGLFVGWCALSQKASTYAGLQNTCLVWDTGHLMNTKQKYPHFSQRTWRNIKIKVKFSVVFPFVPFSPEQSIFFIIPRCPRFI
jgi:hypothetical protein